MALISIILAFFFFLTEVTHSFLSDLGLRQLIDERGKKRDPLDLWVTKRHRLVSVIIIGRTLSVIASAVFSYKAIAAGFSGINVLWAYSAFILVMLFLTGYLPHVLAAKAAERIAVIAVYPLKFFYYLFFPVHAVFGIPQKFMANEGERVTKDDLAYLVDMSEEQGELEGENRRMLSNILDIAESTVKSILSPRTEMVAVEDTVTKEEFLKIVRDSGFSRIPVYKDNLDHIVGILFIKDILRFADEWRMEELMDMMHPALFVPESKKTSEMLKEFQRSHQQLAIVVDEFGGVAGLVTMEDVLEEIVGEIWDEYDEEEAAKEEIREVGENRYLVGARTNLEDLFEFFGLENEENGEDYDTVGGLIYHLAGAIPKVGDRLNWRDFSIVVITMEDNKILNAEFIKAVSD